MIFMGFVFCVLQLLGDKAGASDTKRVDQTPPFIVKRTGQSVDSEINCAHSITNYDQILWYKQDKHKLKFLGFLNLDNPNPEDDVKGKISFKGDGRKHSNLTISNVSLNDSGVYFCAARYTEAYFGAGTKLTVLDPKRKITPPTVKVFQPSSKECRNLKDEKERKKTLLCVARDFYPDHVSIFWQVNAKNVTKGVATDPAARLDDKTYFITSRLRVHAEVWTSPGTNFSCFVTFFDGNKTIIKDETVFAVEAYVPSVKTRVKYLRSTQSFKLSYTVFIIKSSIYGAFVAFLVWKLQGSTGKQKY